MVLPVACGRSRVAGLGLYGVLRLSQAATAFVPDVTVRIVQPALGQLQKWDPDNKDEVLSTYFRLSAPEGAPLAQAARCSSGRNRPFPFPLTQDPGVLAAIAELLPEGTALVTGAYREEYPPSGERQVFNTIYVDRRGRNDPRRLRQGASRALRRIPAGAASCSSGSGSGSSRPEQLLAGPGAAADLTLPFGPALPAAHLLRGDLLRRGALARAAAGLHAQRDE